VRRVSFRLPADDRENLLDELMPLPPAPLVLANAPPAVHAVWRKRLPRARRLPRRRRPPRAGSLSLPRRRRAPRAGSLSLPRRRRPAAGSSPPAAVRRVIASGLVAVELRAAIRACEAAGFGVTRRLDADGWAAALLERGGG
jgi:hypothetical protein